MQYYSDATHQSYFDKGFIENTVTCNTRDIIFNILHNMLGQQKQYVIQYYVSGTIHSAVGDTLPSVSTSLSMTVNNYSMWDKGHLLLILPC